MNWRMLTPVALVVCGLLIGCSKSPEQDTVTSFNKEGHPPQPFDGRNGDGEGISAFGYGQFRDLGGHLPIAHTSRLQSGWDEHSTRRGQKNQGTFYKLPSGEAPLPSQARYPSPHMSFTSFR